MTRNKVKEKKKTCSENRGDLFIFFGWKWQNKYKETKHLQINEHTSMWMYNRTLSWWKTNTKNFAVDTQCHNVWLVHSPDTRVALWLRLGLGSCLGDHSWIYSRTTFSQWTHWKHTVWHHLKEEKEELTLNVQLISCWKIVSQLIFCCAEIVSTVARVNNINYQDWSGAYFLFIIFVPGVVGNGWDGSAFTEQSDKASLEYWTIFVDEDCGFLWRNWERK